MYTCIHIHKHKSKIKAHIITCVYMQRCYEQIYIIQICTNTHLLTYTHAQRFSDLCYDPRPRKESVCRMSPSMLELVKKFFAAPA